MRAVAAAAAFLLAAAGARAEIIDRVLAVVNGQIITLSDVRAALRLGLVPPDVSQDPVAAGLQRLIDRRLMLTEVERYAPPEPAPSLVDAAVHAMEARFKDRLEFETVLNRYGLPYEQLVQFVTDDLRLELYQRQRFSIPRPSEDELARYYKDHANEFVADGRQRPFDEVRDQVLARAMTARRDDVVRDWLAGLRRRASITIMYLPARR